MATSYSLHQRDPRTRLFDAYDKSGPSSRQSGTNSARRSGTGSPAAGYGSSTNSTHPHEHPSILKSRSENVDGSARLNARPFDPSMLDGLESQGDPEFEGIGSKVKALANLSFAIGREITESNKLLDKMTDQYERARYQVSGTMNRMLRAAASTGVGWKVWLGFFAAVALLFWYVWL